MQTVSGILPSTLQTQGMLNKAVPQTSFAVIANSLATASKATARVVYTALYCIGEIGFQSDGVDKTLKGIAGVAVWCMASGRNLSLCKHIADSANAVDRGFSGIAFFSRLNAVVETDKAGNGFTARLKKDILKTSTTFFQAVSKSFEFTRLMQGVGLLASAEWFIQADAVYLGGLVARIGNASVIGRMAFDVGLGGCKNFFLFIACSYNILNCTLSLLDPKTNWYNFTVSALSIGADVGKNTLILMVYSVTHTWAAVAIATAICSLAKIALRALPPAPNNADPDWKPIVYPEWMRA